MIEFVEIDNTEDSDFPAAMEIYSGAFPESEKHPVDVIRKRVREGLSKLHVGRLNNEVVFIALLWPLKDTSFILLDYMATKDIHRSKGIGSAFVKQMHDVLVRDRKYFILEVENTEHGMNKEERRRRVLFYKRLGAKEMKNVRYVLPALDGGAPTEMRLMVYPEYEREVLHGNTVKDLVVRIYRELYGRGSQDSLVQTFVDSIRDRVEMV